MENDSRVARRPASSASLTEAREDRASAIDFIQNLKLDTLTMRGSDDEDQTFNMSSIIERKSLTSNVRHLENDYQRPFANRRASLPSLTTSPLSRSYYSRSERESYLDTYETHKRTRSTQDDSSPILTPQYQAVSAGASLHTIHSLVREDPKSLRLRNGGGLTPLHCAIERYDTPVSVLMLLLESDPSSAALRCFVRGLSPVDLLWKRLVQPDSYRSTQVKERARNIRETMEEGASVETMAGRLSGQTRSDSVSVTPPNGKQPLANSCLQDNLELRDFSGT